MARSFTLRAVAVVALLLVGVGLASAFSVSLTGFHTTYAARQVDPVADAPAIANHTHAVVDLDRLVGDFTPADRRAVRNATTGPAVRVLHPDAPLATLPDDNIEYAVYGREYYRANVTYLHDRDGIGRSNFSLRMNFTRVDTETAMDDLAVDYANASSGVQRVVDTGNGMLDGNLTATPLVDRGGDYSLIYISNGGAVFARLFLAAVSIPAGLVGRAYLAVAIALGLLLARTGVPRPITRRRAYGVVVATFPLSLVAAATLTAPVTVGRVLGWGALTLPLACAVPAGVAIHNRRWRGVALASAVAVGCLLAAVAAIAVLSSVFLAAVVLVASALVVPFAGVPLLGFGAWLASPDPTSE